MSLYPKQLKFEESKRSGFKGFATHHTIKAPKNQTSDPKMFLVVVKQNALEKFKPQTKIRVVLRARMKHAVPENKNVFLLGISKSSEGTELMDREHGS